MHMSEQLISIITVGRPLCFPGRRRLQSRIESERQVDNLRRTLEALCPSLPFPDYQR